jgi:hypothetical protein
MQISLSLCNVSPSTSDMHGARIPQSSETRKRGSRPQAPPDQGWSAEADRGPFAHAPGLAHPTSSCARCHNLQHPRLGGIGCHNVELWSALVGQGFAGFPFFPKADSSDRPRDGLHLTPLRKWSAVSVSTINLRIVAVRLGAACLCRVDLGCLSPLRGKRPSTVRSRLEMPPTVPFQRPRG